MSEGAVSSDKEEILIKLKDMLEKTSDEDMGRMTLKSVMNDLKAFFGEDKQEAIMEMKEDLKALITERFMAQEPVEKNMEVDEAQDEAEDDDDDDDDDEEEDEEEDDEHPDIASLPEEWKARFESVVWVKTSKQFPWWPSFIYNPANLSKKLKMGALKHLGKKHVTYCYGTNDYEFPIPSQIKPFLENVEEFSVQKVPKKYQTKFAKGVELAKKDVELPKDDRVSWNHKERKRPVKKAKPVAKVAAAPKKTKEKAPSKKTAKAKSASKKKKDEVPEQSEVDEKSFSEEEPSDEPSEESAEDEDEDEEEEFALEDEDDEVEDEDDEYVEGSTKKPKKHSSKKKSSSEDKNEVKAKKKRARSGSEKEKKPAKKSDEDGEAPAKKKKKVLTDEEKEQRRKDKKEKDKAKEKAQEKKRKAPSISKDQPLTGAQKKKILEEKNAMERNRINAMKNSSEPVWKQARSALPNAAASSTSSVKPKTSSSAPVARPVETPVERARRLCQLIELRLRTEEKKGAGQFETAGVIKIMRKARNMELSVKEWTESKVIELVNTLRKYQHSAEIANEAKEIRSYLKNKITAMTASADIAAAGSSNVASSSASGEAPPLAPTQGN